MNSEEELWAAASALVEEHGPDAAIRAAQEADSALERADLDGAHAWRVVTRRAAILLEAMKAASN